MTAQAPTAENPAPATNGHDQRGRFTAGNPGGPGNPFARRVAALRKSLLDAVSAEDVQAIVQKLVQLAKDGDVPAAKLVLSYAVGKPQPAPEPDRMDADEWEGYRKTTAMTKEKAAVIASGVPEFHLDCVRNLRPVIAELAQKNARQFACELDDAAFESGDPWSVQKNLEVQRFLNDYLTPKATNAPPAPSPNGSNGKKTPAPRTRSASTSQMPVACAAG